VWQGVNGFENSHRSTLLGSTARRQLSNHPSARRTRRPESGATSARVRVSDRSVVRAGDGDAWDDAHVSEVPRRELVVWAVAGCVAVAALAVGMRFDTSWNWWVWNADALTPFLMAGDLVGGGSFGEWFPAHSPYLFPDVAVSAVARLVAGGGSAGVLTVGVLQVLALAAGVGVLAGGGFEGWVRAAALTSVVWALVVALVAEPFALVGANGHHVGVFVVGVWVLAVLVQRWPDGAGSVGRFVGLAAVCAMCAMSDLLFVLQVAPAVVVWWWLTGRPGLVSVMSAVVSGSVLGVVVAPLVVPNWSRVPAGVSLSGARTRLGVLVDVVLEGRGRPLAVGVVLAVANVACVVVLVRWVLRRLRGRSMGRTRSNALVAVVVWVGCAAVGMTAAVAVSSAFPVAERYLLVALWGPVVAGVVTVSGWLGRSSGRVRVRASAAGVPVTAVAGVAAVAASGVLVAVSVGVASGSGSDREAPWMPGSVSLGCVESVLAAGDAVSVVSQYWDAKVFAVHVGGGHRFAQFMPDGVPYRFATSEGSFEVDGRYDAIVVSAHAGPAHEVDVGRVVSVAGVPVVDEVCGPWRVLVFGRDGLAWGGG
jgi:hypothetical protein